jgi:hypothetical protein
VKTHHYSFGAAFLVAHLVRISNETVNAEDTIKDISKQTARLLKITIVSGSSSRKYMYHFFFVK